MSRRSKPNQWVVVGKSKLPEWIVNWRATGKADAAEIAAAVQVAINALFESKAKPDAKTIRKDVGPIVETLVIEVQKA